jgi:hypothetical protein
VLHDPIHPFFGQPDEVSSLWSGRAGAGVSLAGPDHNDDHAASHAVSGVLHGLRGLHPPKHLRPVANVRRKKRKKENKEKMGDHKEKSQHPSPKQKSPLHFKNYFSFSFFFLFF